MTLFCWYLHTSSYVLSSLWNTVSLNLKKKKKTLLWAWSPPFDIWSTNWKGGFDNITHATIAGNQGNHNHLSLGKSLRQANRKNEGSYQIFRRGCFGKICHQVAQFYWKHHKIIWSPHFFSSVWQTYTHQYHIASMTKNKTKQNKKVKHKVKRHLALRSLVSH